MTYLQLNIIHGPNICMAFPLNIGNQLPMLLITLCSTYYEESMQCHEEGLNGLELVTKLLRIFQELESEMIRQDVGALPHLRVFSHELKDEHIYEYCMIVKSMLCYDKLSC